jgi:hypothetical protein
MVLQIKSSKLCETVKCSEFSEGKKAASPPIATAQRSNIGAGGSLASLLRDVKRTE